MNTGFNKDMLSALRVGKSQDKEEPKFEMSFSTGDEEMEPMIYLNDPWIPSGGVVGIYGRGEAGKSTLASTWCAEASQNHFVSTLWISSEEPKEHISTRYYKSQGAEETLIAMRYMPKIEGEETYVTFNVYEHLEPAIKQAVAMHGTGLRRLGIVVLDAIAALVHFDKGENANDDKSVKRLIAFLHTLSERYGLTIIILGHLNKNATGKFREDMVTGSAAWTNSPRVAYAVHKDRNADSDYESIVEKIKANTGTRFAARWQTQPVHTMHTREGDAPDEVLCRSERVSDIAWGTRAIEEMVTENEPDSKPDKRSKEQAKEAEEHVTLLAIANAVREGRDNRKDIIQFVKDMDSTAKVSESKWSRLDWDARLVGYGVLMDKTTHNRTVYCMNELGVFSPKTEE